MRANEFIVEYRKNAMVGGIDLSFEYDDKFGESARVQAFSNGRKLGYAEFLVVKDNELEATDLEVDERYRGQGIARLMYDFVKQQGYKIHRSHAQTMDGHAFWNKNRDEERVWESFDRPYPIKWEKGEHGDYDALAQLGDGTYLSIMFNNEGDDEYQIEFHRNNSQAVTGEGDAQRVFATVLNAIQQFLKVEQPWRFIFSASKDVETGQNSQSRAKLYDRLIQRYASSWGYDVYHEDHGDQITYELTRLKQGLAENQLDEISRDRLERYLSRATRQVDSRQERMALARQRLNTSYEIYRADEPTKIVDRFEADTPVDAQRYYQDYIERYESDVDYDLRLRRGTGIMEGLYDANPATYDLPRRPLNVPELIKRGAIFITEPHGDNGWEPDAEGFSLITLYNVAKGGWPAEAKQHLKPSMYRAAATGLNRQGPGTMLYDGKYRQILWSIKKLGIPDEVAFLDKQAVAEFAPSPERNNNDDVPDPIFVLANRWWNAAEKQPQIESVLNSMGWSIQQVESEDDAVQLQHRDGTSYFISADDFDPDVFENFADGKIKGKSRPGRVKRSGASCNGSVTDLRRKAKATSGEKAKMYHWCANMKSGRKKNK